MQHEADLGKRRDAWHTLLDWLWLAIALYLPCSYLFPINSTYNVDWPNNMWLIGYYGECFRHHLTMPEVVNTPDFSGLAYPVFYGTLSYPLLGMISLVSSPPVALRIGVILLFLAQYRLVYQATARLGAPTFWARVVSCMVIWTVYPLTNLYNRAALAEFFATGLLVCAFALLQLMFHGRNRRELSIYACGLAFCLTISVGAHPITGMFGIPLLFVVALLLWWLLPCDGPSRKLILLLSLPWVTAAVACVAPWLYATGKFCKHLSIWQGSAGVVFFRYVQWLAEHSYAARNVYSRVPILRQFGEFARQQGAQSFEDLQISVEPFISQWVRKHGSHYKEIPRWVEHEASAPL